jgi:hypothetical protein
MLLYGLLRASVSCYMYVSMYSIVLAEKCFLSYYNILVPK